jgi:hypothetical protein
MPDTERHVKACKWADEESFRLYGTDSISDKDLLWPRWLELYSKFLQDNYYNKDQGKRSAFTSRGNYHD